MKKFFTYILIILAVGLAACRKADSVHEPRSGRITIAMDVEQLEGAQLTKATPASSLTEIQAEIYNDSGELQTDVRVEVSKDLKQIFIEGLMDGDFTLVLLGVGAVADPLTSQIVPPTTLGGAWFQPPAYASPADNEYFYAKTSFTIGAGLAEAQNVTLQRLSARVDVVPANKDGIWNGGTITEAKVSLTTGQVFSAVTAAGELFMPTTITNLDVLKRLSFYTLPATTSDKVSGSVFLKGTDDAGRPMEFSYPFSVNVVRNKIITIRPQYVAEDNPFGTIKLYERDLSRQFVKRFFQDGDSYVSVASRTYRPIEPITFAISDKRITISNYLANPLKDVSIYMRLGNTGEFFEVAWFEKMNPFEEYIFDLNKLPKNKIYRTESGGVLMVENLFSVGNVKLKYVSTDAASNRLLDAVNQITWPIVIQYEPPTADTIAQSGRFLPLRPIHARLMAALTVNMGYLLTSDTWMNKMRATELYNDDKVKLDFDKNILTIILKPDQRRNFLKVTTISPWHKDNSVTLGVAWIGWGDLFSIHQASMQAQFNSTDETYRTTAYHEYGHVMGFGHNSNLAYGAMQSVTHWALDELVRANRLPYCVEPEGIGSYAGLYTKPGTKATTEITYFDNPEL